MNTHINTKKHGEMAADTEMITNDMESLDSYGFTYKELLRLQNWYQTRGSDRIEVVRRWEFLKFLVINGKLDS